MHRADSDGQINEFLARMKASPLLAATGGHTESRHMLDCLDLYVEGLKGYQNTVEEMKKPRA